MGPQRTVSAALSVCQQPQSHDRGTGYRLPRYLHALNPKSEAQKVRDTDGCRDLDPAFWQCAELEYSFSHVVSGWRV